ncbi:MAG TPA: hypothetical protein V6D15_17315 [Oculatellaceae cyanobacterium]
MIESGLLKLLGNFGAAVANGTIHDNFWNVGDRSLLLWCDGATRTARGDHIRGNCR